MSTEIHPVSNKTKPSPAASRPQSQRFEWKRWGSIAASWIIAALFVAVEIRRVGGQVAVRYPDFFPWVRRAIQFDPRHLGQWQWVDGLYPLGYPLLLRLGVTLGADVLETAFTLSILGGFLGLLGTFALVQRLTGSRTLALFSEAILASTAHYLFFASLDSTDMLASGLQICSLAVMLAKGQRRRTLFGAGVLAGLSYLIRYTASLHILLCFLYLAGLAWVQRNVPEQNEKKRNWWKKPTIYLLGAGIGAAPQLIASTIVKGNPFYTHQAHNLWFHLTGGSDYIFDWNAAPMDISLWEIVSTYPRELFARWLDQFRSFWTTREAVVLDAPFAPLMHAGLIFTLLVPGKLRRSGRAFVGTYVVGHIALLSLIRLDKRFLIALMPLLAFTTLYFLWQILPRELQFRWGKIPVRIPALILLTIWSMHYPLRFMRSNPEDRGIVEISNTLHAAGMQSADQVYSTHLRYHDVADPWKRRFDMAFTIAPELESYDDLLNLLHSRGYQFFIYDDDTGVSLYPNLDFLLAPESRPEGLAPVHVDEERDLVIYRVRGDQSSTYKEIDAAWANGITLQGYEAHLSEDMPRRDQQERLGVYLHWQTTQPVTQMLKVFVHVIDANGQLVGQSDGLPVLWTHNTNEWTVGETIVDFHQIPFEKPLAPGSYAVQAGLYTEGEGRIAVLDASGAPSGDAVTLQTLTIP